jgi:hypothetical protein
MSKMWIGWRAGIGRILHGLFALQTTAALMDEHRVNEMLALHPVRV